MGKSFNPEAFAKGFSGMGKAMGALAGVALGLGLSACNAENIKVNGEEGVTLSELDLTGKAPTSLVLAGPDTVKLTEGDALAITVEGSEAVKSALRFTLDDDTLAVMRTKDAPKDETAIVLVTMPKPQTIVVAGSGRVETAGLASAAEVTVTGSGTVASGDLDIESLDANILGSGSFSASGMAKTLDLNIAGSGEANMAELQVSTADVSIAGSGRGAFRSDGEVDANILGSGKVTVRGRAKCKISAVGSGKLVCEEG